MPKLPGVITSLGNVRAHTSRVAEEIANRWRLTFIWGYAAKAGEHGEGRALDFMGFDGGTVKNPGPMRPNVCEEIADYLWANRARLGVWYVIWNRRIISANRSGYAYNKWTAYRGSNPHTDHVHVSFLDRPPAYRPPATAKPSEEIAVTPAELRKIIGEEIDKRVARAVWSYALKPGATATRIGKYPAGVKYSAGALLIGPDAKANELRREHVPAILDAVADVAKLAAAPMSEVERAELAADIAARTDRLRVEITHDDATDEPEPEPAPE